MNKIIDFRGKTPLKLGMKWGGNIPALSAMNVKDGIIKFNEDTHYGSIELYEKWMTKGDCTKGDIVLTMEAPMGNVAQIPNNQKYILSQRVILLKFNEKLVSNEYMYQYLRSPYFKKQMNRYATGTTAKGIKQKNLIKIRLKIPSLLEQKFIGTFLSAIDKKIGFMEKIVENFLSYHKYIIQHLPLDPHNLIKKEGWQLLYLNEILFEHKLKSNGFEEVFSVSVEKGLINQIEHLGRSFSAKNTDKYNLVKYGDIVYTKSPTGDFPLGIIKQSHVKNNVIVSPLYGIFTPKTFELGYILENYFKYPVNCHNYLHSIVQKGAKNTMNITNKTFLSKQLYLPTNINEQKRIFNILYSLNRKIDLISDEIKEMREFKKGLLQKMFC